MPLTSPQLDDRRFDDLVNAARDRVQQSAPTWTDLSTSEPGLTLLEVFAFLADTTIFRLNQVPDKLYVEFLKLIGVRIQPPAAALVDVRFRRERDSGVAIEIPRGTRVTAAGPGAASDLPVFATLEATAIAAGTDETVVRAIHAELVEAELLGRSSGAPGQSFRVARRPIIAPSGDPLDLVLAVEATAEELERADRAIEHDGRPFRIWREVDDFADVGADRDVYVVDRSDGLVTFAPAARTLDAGGTLGDTPSTLAGVPPIDREVRAWYRHGGGPAGNVKAGTLTTLRDAIPGVTVTNPGAATGGRAAETLENALTRGPQELRSLSRAVTARDFRLVAERSSGAVARAHAFTQAALWRYARPGTVELVIVPALPETEASASMTVAQLSALQSDAALEQVAAAIDVRRPLGTSCVVRWARYKSVRVRAEIVVHGEEDVDAVRARVDERIHRTIDPLPSDVSPDGWPFGQPLHASRVYRIILSEPGVRHARRVRLLLDEVPDRDVQTLAADPHQPRTWYAGSGDALFRSLNDGDGWELMNRFEGRQVRRIEASEHVPGLVAVACAPAEGAGSSVHVTRDAGESWPFERPFGFRVEDLAWVMREGAPVLLMATGPSGDGGGGGLYQMDVTPDADAVQVLVDPADQDLAFYAVTAFQEVRGDVAVAVAAQGKGGVYLSKQGGHGGTFQQTGLTGEDVRVLAVQALGPRAFLWAGTAAPGGDQVGKGLFRRELLGADDPVDGWKHLGKGWIAGSCWDIAFEGTTVAAATQQFGVMRLVTDVPVPAWTDPTGDVHNGLPLRDLNRFLPVRAVAARQDGGPLMAGGPDGVYRTLADADRSGGLPRYESCSEREHDEEVTLPPTWLFVCGENELVVRADAPG